MVRGHAGKGERFSLDLAEAEAHCFDPSRITAWFPRERTREDGEKAAAREMHDRTAGTMSAKMGRGCIILFVFRSPCRTNPCMMRE